MTGSFYRQKKKKNNQKKNNKKKTLLRAGLKETNFSKKRATSKLTNANPSAPDTKCRTQEDTATFNIGPDVRNLTSTV